MKRKQAPVFLGREWGIITLRPICARQPALCPQISFGAFVNKLLIITHEKLHRCLEESSQAVSRTPALWTYGRFLPTKTQNKTELRIENALADLCSPEITVPAVAGAAEV